MADEPQKWPECPPGAPLWMCTFADLMSLLMCFFVLLLSFAVMDQQKYKQVAGAMKDAFGVQAQQRVTAERKGNTMLATQFDTVPLAIQIQIARVFAEDVDAGKVETDYSPDGFILRVKGAAAFDPGDTKIKKSFLPLLNKIARVAQKGELLVEVSGHTDNVKLAKGQGPFRSNWGLSSGRAVAVVEYMLRHFTIPPERLAAVGYGHGQPIATNNTVEGRAQNRRVEFKIKPGGAQVVIDKLATERGIISQ